MKEKIRFAILTFFFAQGLCMASCAVSRISKMYLQPIMHFIGGDFIYDTMASLAFLAGLS